MNQTPNTQNLPIQQGVQHGPYLTEGMQQNDAPYTIKQEQLSAHRDAAHAAFDDGRIDAESLRALDAEALQAQKTQQKTLRETIGEAAVASALSREDKKKVDTKYGIRPASTLVSKVSEPYRKAKLRVKREIIEAHLGNPEARR